MTTTDHTMTTTDHGEILAVLHGIHDAIAAEDAAGVYAAYTPDAVRSDLAPPLVQVHGTEAEFVEGLTAWMSTFVAPPRLAFRDPQVEVGGDVAWVFALTSMTATPAAPGQGEFTLWFRSTYGMRRVDGRWLVAHHHESVPFLMDGSFLAATGLQP